MRALETICRDMGSAVLLVSLQRQPEMDVDAAGEQDSSLRVLCDTSRLRLERIRTRGM